VRRKNVTLRISRRETAARYWLQSLFPFERFEGFDERERERERKEKKDGIVF
jgi:hypothetical protein